MKLKITTQVLYLSHSPKLLPDKTPKKDIGGRLLYVVKVLDTEHDEVIRISAPLSAEFIEGINVLDPVKVTSLRYGVFKGSLYQNGLVDFVTDEAVLI